MGISGYGEKERRAPSDLNLDYIAPTEELDIVKTSPQDFSGAMELEMKSQQALATIPEGFSSMMSDKISADRQLDSLNADVEAQKKDIDQQIQQARLKDLTTNSLKSAVVDAHMQKASAVIEGEQQAMAEGSSVYEAAKNTLSQFKNPFADTTGGTELWQSLSLDYDNQVLQKALNKDYEIQQAKAANNLEVLQNTTIADVALGNMDIDSAMSTMSKNVALYRDNMPDIAVKDSLNTAFNNVVLAKANYLVRSLNGSNGEQVSEALQQLVVSNKARTFTLLDKSGKPIMVEGKPSVLTTSLAPDTIATLMNKSQEALVKTFGGNGGASNSAIIDNYEEAVGYAELKKNGVNDYMMSADPTVAFSDYQAALRGVQNSNKSVSDKSKLYQEISDKYYEVVMPSVLTVQAMRATPNVVANRQKIVSRLAVLNQRLNSGQSMTDFSMDFDIGSGRTITLKPQLNSMSGLDPQQTARNAWTTIRDTMTRAVSAPDNADFAFHTNAEYNKSMGAAITSLSRVNLVSTNNKGESWVSDQGVNKLSEYLIGAKQSLRDVTGGSSAYSSVPDKLVQELDHQYNEIPGPKQKLDYTRAVAKAMLKAGYTDALLAPGKGTANAATKALAREIYLQNPGLKHVSAAIDAYTKTGATGLSEGAAKFALGEKVDRQSFGETVNKLIAENRVPAEYQETLRDTLNQAATALAYTGSSDIKKDLTNIVKSNFSKLNSKYVVDSVFMGSPFMTQHGVNAQQLINESGRKTEQTLRSIGVDTGKYPVQIKPNSEYGIAEVFVGGKRASLTSSKLDNRISIGVPYSAPKPSTVDEGSWQSVLSDFSAITTTLSHTADPTFTKTAQQKIAGKAMSVGIGGDLFYTGGNKSALTDTERQGVNRLGRDSVLLLSEMQSDGFMKSFADYKTNSAKLGQVSKAPAYLTRTLFGDVSPVSKEMIDYAYAKATAFNKISTVPNNLVSAEIQGVRLNDQLQVAQNKGFSVIPATTDVIKAAADAGIKLSRTMDKNSYSNVKDASLHNIGRAIDVGIYANAMEDNVTGMLKPQALGNFIKLVTTNPAYAQSLSRIGTSRPELLDNKPEYAAYAKYRNMKNKEGKPLFVDMRDYDRKFLPKQNWHDNHFHISFSSRVIDSKGRGIPAGARQSLAMDMVKTQSNAYNYIDNRTANALVGAFADGYGVANNKTFGVANLMKQDYLNLGIPENSLNDPIMQTRALGNTFQKYSNILGSSDLAVFALAGAKFKNTTTDDILDIKEILSKRKTNLGEVRYVLATPLNARNQVDAVEQARMNAIYRRYKKAYAAGRVID